MQSENNQPNLFLTWFGLGRLPGAPGTWGTLGAIPFILLTHWLGPWVDMGSCVLFIILSVWACQRYEAQTGSHDPGKIVVDEVVGLMVALVWIPITWLSVLIAFVVFRILDILKPYPISVIDKKLGGGFGVVADDLAAGLVTNFLLQVMLVKYGFFGPAFVPFQ